ncbi:6781_t:CDS:1 [Paraglomus brasilianum]|uniref:6781_t:CDS:1 n=1 Tax=Paraglomus brasilianum TaxID=144538 RepID=A0A9N8VFA5_9GLOM|nr:6781_t:CDS:1 [Paraglomus brasilianum]
MHHASKALISNNFMLTFIRNRRIISVISTRRTFNFIRPNRLEHNISHIIRKDISQCHSISTSIGVFSKDAVFSPNAGTSDVGQSIIPVVTPELESESLRDHDLSIHKERIMKSTIGTKADVSKKEEEKTFRIDVIDRDIDDIWKDYKNADPVQLQQMEERDFNQLLAAFKPHISKPGVSQMMRTIFSDRRDKATSAYNIMISMFVELKDLESARQLFKKMKKIEIFPDTVTYNTMIQAHSKLGSPMNAILMFDEMRERQILRTLRSYTLMIDACGKTTNVYGGETRIERAKAFFELMKNEQLQPDEKIYNTLIKVCAHNHPRMDLALEYFTEMKNAGLIPTIVTYNTLIKGFIDRKDRMRALEIFEEMKVAGIPPDAFIYEQLGRKGKNGMLELKLVKAKLTIRDYNAFLNHALVESNYSEALDIYKDMVISRVKPNAVTYSLLINVHVKLRDLENAIRVLNSMQDEGVRPDTYTYSNIVNGLLSDRNLKVAFEVLENMIKSEVKPNAGSFNAFITAAQEADDYELAESMYERMKSLNVQPDRITFRLILWLAAQHKDDIVIKRYLKEMRVNYAINENAEIYQQIITGFCKAGKLRDAWRWYKKMRERELKPTHFILSVLASNFYSAELYEDALNIWHKMAAFNYVPDEEDIDIFLSCCDVLGKDGVADSIAKYMENHNVFIKDKRERSIDSRNSDKYIPASKERQTNARSSRRYGTDYNRLSNFRV